MPIRAINRISTRRAETSYRSCGAVRVGRHERTGLCAHRFLKELATLANQLGQLPAGRCLEGQADKVGVDRGVVESRPGSVGGRFDP